MTLTTTSATNTSHDDEFIRLAADLDEAVAALNHLDDNSRELALELKRSLEALYSSALRQVVRTLRDDEAGLSFLHSLAQIPEVRTVLSIAKILRPNMVGLANSAIEEVRPYLNSHGGDAEVVAVEGRRIQLRLLGACSGCSMSATTLSQEVEAALYRAIPELEGVDLVQDQPTPALLHLGTTRHKDSDWVQGPHLDEIGQRSLYRVDFDNVSLIITNFEGKLACFRNECAHQGMELDRATVDEEGTLTCPWHGFRFDALSGECISQPGVQLDQFPLKVVDKIVLIRLDG